MKKLLTVALFAISAVAMPMTADAALVKAPGKTVQCRDAKGKFKKC